MAKFLDWADKQLGDPLDAIKGKLEGFPQWAQEVLVKDAIQNKRLKKSLNNPEVQALMGTTEGIMQIMTLLFQQTHPELTEDQVGDIFDGIVEEHGYQYLQDKIQESQGIVEDEEEPKQEGEAKKK